MKPQEALIAAATDAMSVVWQYKNDLLYPPTGDSIGRRLARASEVAANLERAILKAEGDGEARAAPPAEPRKGEEA